MLRQITLEDKKEEVRLQDGKKVISITPAQEIAPVAQMVYTKEMIVDIIALLTKQIEDSQSQLEAWTDRLARLA